MTLPVEIQPMDVLRQRFAAAVERVWDIDTVNEDAPVGDRAGKHRAHVFDLEAGDGDQWRLIISRDRKEDLECLHVSVSWMRRATKKSKQQRVWQLQRILHEVTGASPQADRHGDFIRRRPTSFWPAEVIAKDRKLGSL